MEQDSLWKKTRLTLLKEEKSPLDDEDHVSLLKVDDPLIFFKRASSCSSSPDDEKYLSRVSLFFFSPSWQNEEEWRTDFCWRRERMECSFSLFKKRSRDEAFLESLRHEEFFYRSLLLVSCESLDHCIVLSCWWTSTENRISFWNRKEVSLYPLEFFLLSEKKL